MGMRMRMRAGAAMPVRMGAGQGARRSRRSGGSGGVRTGVGCRRSGGAGRTGGCGVLVWVSMGTEGWCVLSILFISSFLESSSPFPAPLTPSFCRPSPSFPWPFSRSSLSVDISLSISSIIPSTHSSDSFYFIGIIISFLPSHLLPSPSVVHRRLFPWPLSVFFILGYFSFPFRPLSSALLYYPFQAPFQPPSSPPSILHPPYISFRPRPLGASIPRVFVSFTHLLTNLCPLAPRRPLRGRRRPGGAGRDPLPLRLARGRRLLHRV
ncbi:hypothetical protein B0H17DRAFT_405927 [Mycena rosella]|uniref:Uncharacterized protein n=1 Tax=Mycena rosella TaxID=1033263 RepID=A0AAD7G2E8_MYCRO|nr:hypothetical protein B0H17DRAFT_405927 [Mycena rosella]